jgi:hypothetical protein
MEDWKARADEARGAIRAGNLEIGKAARADLDRTMLAVVMAARTYDEEWILDCDGGYLALIPGELEHWKKDRDALRAALAAYEKARDYAGVVMAHEKELALDKTFEAGIAAIESSSKGGGAE